MGKYKPINETARRMGAMLRRARRMCRMSTDDAALLLQMMPDELAQYEHGVCEIPINILEHMFVMGYKMIQVRKLERRYHNQRELFYKLKKTVAEAE